MSVRRILIAGMPSSGKTTYMAAMRHVLLSDETKTALLMSRLADDERHLNLLQDRWLALETFERTREKSEAWVTLHVRDRMTEVEADLEMPDLRGEMFERPAAFGMCHRQVAEALVESDGILLFTNAEKPDDNLLISDFGDLDDNEGAPADGKSDPEVSESKKSSEASRNPTDGVDDPDANIARPAGTTGRTRFQADRMPEEAKIVELLQFANRSPRTRRRRRLGLIVSAWDVVIDGEDIRDPTQWLAQQRPMLAQFLRYNADAWDVRVYGASAQGGKLPRDEARLKAIETASERIVMIGHDVPRHDPTAPLGWLISGG